MLEKASQFLQDQQGPSRAFSQTGAAHFPDEPIPSVRVYVLDDQGTIVSINVAQKGTPKENGIAPKGIYLGGNLFNEPTQPGIRSIQSDLAEAFRKVISGEEEQLAIPCQQRDDEEFGWSFSLLSGFEMEEKKYVIVIQVEHASQLQAKSSLQLISTALSAVANAIVITDSDGIIHWANPAFERLTGYTISETVGKNPRDLVRSGKQPKGFYRKLWKTILSGKVWHGTLVNRRKDGALYWEEMTITPFRQNGNALTHFIAVKQDVTERIRREREREAIATLATSLRNVRNRAETIEIVLDLLVDLLELDGVYFISPKEAYSENRVEFSAGPARRLFKEVVLPAGAGVAGQVISTGKAYHSNDLRRDGLFLYTALLPADVNTVACVPLVNEDEIVGAVLALGKSPISTGEMKLLTAISEMAGGAIHRAQLFERTQHQLVRVSALRAIDGAIIQHLDIKVTLRLITDQLIRRLNVGAAAIAFLDPDTGRLEYIETRGFVTEYVPFAKSKQDILPGSRAIHENHPISLPKPAVWALSEELVRLWEQEQFTKAYFIPLILADQALGVMEVYLRSELPAESEWVAFLETLAGQAMIAIEDARLYAETRRAHLELLSAYDTTIEGWSRAMDLRDRETEGHTRRVSELTMQLAQKVNIPGDQLINLWRGALLHDIGKMGIPDEILRKAGPLTEDEWVLMKKHPDFAREMLLPIEYLRPALDIPYCHHEKWDGSGYPRGLKGNDIPLAARIFAIADVWDALTSDRPYRPAWAREKALEHIREQSGKHFDPWIVQLFLEIIEGMSPAAGEVIRGDNPKP